jgi:L-gulono-1,4-lactone dehydrogenase
VTAVPRSPSSARRPFRNWAGNQVCLPAERHEPRSVDEVADLVRRAHRDGLRVKVVGAGHSFTDIACTDGLLLSLDRLADVERVDRDRQRVTVQAGIRLHRLNRVLARVGLAMPNLGDIAYQSLAGATQTATHGTGLRHGGLATTIVGLELVTGTGDVVWCDDRTRPELLRVARVGLGALGVVTRVVLQCVPAFDLHARETVEPIADVVADLDHLFSDNDHAELLWMPGARRCQVKRNNRTDEPRRPSSTAEHVRDKLIGENLAFGVVCRVGRRFPTATGRVARLVSTGGSRRDVVDRSDRIFTSPRLVRFYETEHSIPLAALPEAIERVGALVARLGQPVLFPIEVRASAADDIPLSTGYGRPSGWIACHVYRGMPHDAYFQGVARIMDDYGGRPHWGKLHGQDHRTLAGRYPEWDLFGATRAELDPAGTFRNSYLDRVLGPIAGSDGR